MNTFFTSDTHFFHKNILKYTDRPFKDVEEMNEALIDQWNRVVGPDDVIYHLGDVIFGGKDKIPLILPRLKGIKILVAGNHDNKNRLSTHFKEIHNYLEVSGHNGERFILSHFPFEVWNLSHRGSFHLHGHSHGSLPSIGRRLDVGIDGYGTSFNYGPIPMEVISMVLSNRPIHFSDHHGK